MNSSTTVDAGRAAAAVVRPHRAPDELANHHVRHFVHEAVKRCVPDQIYWFNGSDYERRRLVGQAVEEGALVAADAAGLPGCYLRGGPDEPRAGGACDDRSTFVCTPTREAAAPGDNWVGAPAAHARVAELFDRCMAGRTMYVVPFVAGPAGAAAAARAGVLVTDSLFAALRVAAMTATGDAALRLLGGRDDFARVLHSAGDGRAGPGRGYVFRFPAARATYAVGTAHPLGREVIFIPTPPGH